MIENDDIFDALGAEQRRRLLLALFEHEPQRIQELTGPTLALLDGDDHLVEAYLARSGQIPGVDDDRLRQHHVHLPKLVEHCYVEWERDTGLVTKGRRFEELRRVLELLVDVERAETSAVEREETSAVEREETSAVEREVTSAVEHDPAVPDGGTR